MRVHHEFGPFYREDSKILILGSFPSVKSREAEFYYAHPQNRFWRVLSAVFENELPVTLDEKKEFLLKHHIALWDVIESCEIKGSSDASIQEVIPTDLASLIKKTKIQKILLNGKMAEKVYLKYHAHLQVKTFVLPSTSPANAAKRLDDLIEAYRKACL